MLSKRKHRGHPVRVKEPASNTTQPKYIQYIITVAAVLGRVLLFWLLGPLQTSFTLNRCVSMCFHVINATKREW